MSHRYYMVTVAARGMEWTLLILARNMVHAEEQVVAMGLVLLYIVEDMER